MLPTAAVSGFYFSHPQAQYFATAKIGKDQVGDYAKRKDFHPTKITRMHEIKHSIFNHGLL